MSQAITLFMCGDVMTGRGVDQLLPHPSGPRLYERYVKDARDYVALAEEATGPIERPADFAYIWGEALAEMEHVDPDVRLINLETSVTTSDNYWPGKGINYRMHPRNIPCLTTAKIDCCSLANNHVLDWGYAGLLETLETLDQAGVHHAGAGRDRGEAEAPACLPVAGVGRVLVFAIGTEFSGILPEWTATEERPGVHLLPDLSADTVRRIGERVQAVKEPRDVAIASIHWGGNWGYEVPSDQQEFAHALIDEAGIDVVHGHSSHHVKAIDVHGDHLILYGCGDFLTDYEGIGGYEDFRDDLGMMYFADVDPASGRLRSLEMTPTHLQHFRVNRAGAADTEWLRQTLNREGAKFGTRVTVTTENRFRLEWE